jgi:formyl-CoA transferase
MKRLVRNKETSIMSLPLEGIKIIDFTQVQAGPACTQLLAWFGADVLKVERVDGGDITRRQLRDIPNVDALYFTQLNSNKKSLTLNTKTSEGKEILEKLIRTADVLVENFGPGAMDRMGFPWTHIQELNPKLIFASVKGFDEQSPYSDLKVYENVAQCAGGAASTTGFWDGPPTVSAAALGDSNSGMHLAIGILTALIGRQKTGKGQKVSVAMQDCVLNLCRVKLRDQLRLERLGYLEEYPQYPNGKFGDAVPRGGNAGGGGQPGWVLKCKGWETDPNAYIYFTIQEQDWGPTCKALGKPEWINDPAYSTPRARQSHIFEIFADIEKWLADKTKYEAIDKLRPYGIPCAPVLSMKEIAHDPALRASAMIVEVPHKERGPYLTVGSPIKFSDFAPKITGSPLLGENTDEVLTSLGYGSEQIAKLRNANVLLKHADNAAEANQESNAPVLVAK